MACGVIQPLLHADLGKRTSMATETALSDKQRCRLMKKLGRDGLVDAPGQDGLAAFKKVVKFLF